MSISSLMDGKLGYDYMISYIVLIVIVKGGDSYALNLEIGHEA